MAKLPPTRDGTAPRLRAGAYVRVSTQEQAREGYSLGEQQRQVESRIGDEGWEHVRTYIEPGVSGRRDDRPELTKLLAHLDEIDVLVIPALSRLGRSLRQLAAIYERLEAADVQLVSLAESIDTTTAAGRFVHHMLSAAAQFETDQLAERVTGSMKARAREGRYGGGIAPYGYRYERQTEKGRPTGPLVADRAKSPVIERIFREYVEGRSQRAIATGLDADGIPTSNPRRGRSVWHPGTVGQILRNPIYAGQLRYDGEVHDGEHEPLVSQELFEEAARLREGAARTPGHRGGRSTRDPFLFVKGKLRCGLCGEAMVPRSEAGTYECMTRKLRGPERCAQTPVRRELIDVAAWRHFEQVGLDVQATRASVAEDIERATAEVRALRQQAEGDQRRAVARLERVRRDYSDGKLDADEWRSFRDELTGERNAAQAEVERLGERERSIAEGADLIDAEESTLRKLAELRATFARKVTGDSNVEQARAAMERLFERFTLHRQSPELATYAKSTTLYGTAHPKQLVQAAGPDGRTEGLDPGIHPLVPGGYVIEQHPREEAVESLSSEGLIPVLRRTAVSLGSTDVEGLTR